MVLKNVEMCIKSTLQQPGHSEHINNSEFVFFSPSLAQSFSLALTHILPQLNIAKCIQRTFALTRYLRVCVFALQPEQSIL